jgi:hypothetical protein
MQGWDDRLIRQFVGFHLGRSCRVPSLGWRSDNGQDCITAGQAQQIGAAAEKTIELSETYRQLTRSDPTQGCPETTLPRSRALSQKVHVPRHQSNRVSQSMCP